MPTALTNTCSNSGCSRPNRSPTRRLYVCFSSLFAVRSLLCLDLRAVESIIDTLLYVTPTRNLLYVTDTNSGMPSFKFEHLSCFLPGMLALGVHTLDLPLPTRELHTWAAEGIATTCWLTYADQASGLGPDEMTMSHPTPFMSAKWTKLLADWEAAGRPGGVPPGLGPSQPERDSARRDYQALKTTYLLRPEVYPSVAQTYRH